MFNRSDKCGTGTVTYCDCHTFFRQACSQKAHTLTKRESSLTEKVQWRKNNYQNDNIVVTLPQHHRIGQIAQACTVMVVVAITPLQTRKLIRNNKFQATRPKQPHWMRCMPNGSTSHHIARLPSISHEQWHLWLWLPRLCDFWSLVKNVVDAADEERTCHCHLRPMPRFFHRS